MPVISLPLSPGGPILSIAVFVSGPLLTALQNAGATPPQPFVALGLVDTGLRAHADHWRNTAAV
jgi:hypothetical protein